MLFSHSYFSCMASVDRYVQFGHISNVVIVASYFTHSIGFYWKIYSYRTICYPYVKQNKKNSRVCAEQLELERFTEDERSAKAFVECY